MDNTVGGTSEVDMYARLKLEEEEGGALEYENIKAEGDTREIKWCIVGRFLTDRSINFTAMKNTLASVWRPVKGVCIKNLNPNLFLFQFFHELDLNRVLRGGPWTFDHHLLVMTPLEFGMIPQQVPLFHVQFWIQVYDLPSGFMSERVASDIGHFLGCFVEADSNNFAGVWRDYMRIRVSLDIRKPLKRRMKVNKMGDDWEWVNFKYEKLPTFCFFCGVIGHSEKFCEKFFDYPDKSIEKLHGTWLRAPNRRTLNDVGERWLL